MLLNKSSRLYFIRPRLTSQAAFNANSARLTLELRTFLYTFVYGGVVFDTDARNVKHKL